MLNTAAGARGTLFPAPAAVTLLDASLCVAAACLSSCSPACSRAAPRTVAVGTLRAESEALRKPEAFASEVDKVVGTPERAVNRVEGSLNRAGNTVDRLEKTGEKLDRIFK